MSLLRIPRARSVVGRLYVLELDGINEAKVGISGNPAKRADQLAKLEHTKVSRLWFTTRNDLTLFDERRVHAMLTGYKGPRRSSGWEWFYEGFEKAVQIVRRTVDEARCLFTYPVFTVSVIAPARDAGFDRYCWYESKLALTHWSGEFVTTSCPPSSPYGLIPFAFRLSSSGITNDFSDPVRVLGSTVLVDPCTYPRHGDFVLVADMVDGTLRLQNFIASTVSCDAGSARLVLPGRNKSTAVPVNQDRHLLIGTVVETHVDPHAPPHSVWADIMYMNMDNPVGLSSWQVVSSRPPQNRSRPCLPRRQALRKPSRLRR